MRGTDEKFGFTAETQRRRRREIQSFTTKARRHEGKTERLIYRFRRFSQIKESIEAGSGNLWMTSLPGAPLARVENPCHNWYVPDHITRLAPSPTGALHLGNARTFLVNW